MKRKKVKKRKKTNRKGIIFLLMLMGVMAGWLMMGKPAPSFSLPKWQGGNLAQNIPGQNRSPEVYLCKNMTVVNWQNWRQGVAVNLTVTAKTDKEKRDELTRLVDQHSGQIKDSIRSVVGSLRPEHIRDPHLRYVKANIRLSLQRVIPDQKLVEKILVPDWHATGNF
jgi:flagellar basal body-associated protein FliL